MATSRRCAPAASRGLALALVLACVPIAARAAPLEEERRHLAAGQLDDLWFALEGVKKGTHPAGDAAVAALLVEATHAALAKPDPTLALAFGGRARRLAPASAAAWLADAAANLALEQRGAAEEALEQALKLAPKDGEVLFRRAALAQDEGDLALARKLFLAVPAGHARAVEAKQRAASASVALDEQQDARASLERDEAARAKRQAAGPAATAAAPEATSAVATRGGSEIAAIADGTGALQSRVPSDHFQLRYTAGARDFAERARYEQVVVGMFERAWQKVSGRLGRRTSRRIEVILCTKAEFDAFYAPLFGNNLLGFYMGSIVMNLSQHPDDEFFATTVHELTHAFIHDISGEGDVPRWMHEGLARWVERRETGGDYLSFGERGELRLLRDAGRLPAMPKLSDAFSSGGLVMAAYAKSSVAIEVLSGNGGVPRLVDLLESLRGGVGFDAAFTRTYGDRRFAQLDGEIDRLIGR